MLANEDPTRDERCVYKLMGKAQMFMQLEYGVLRVMSALKGRCLLEEEAYRCFLDGCEQGNHDMDVFYDIVSTLAERKVVEWKPAIRLSLSGEGIRCERCGSSNSLKRHDCARCEGVCWMCEACITMGRSRSCERLLIGAPPEPRPVGVAWRVRVRQRLEKVVRKIRGQSDVPDCVNSEDPAVLEEMEESLTSWSLSEPQKAAVRDMFAFLMSPTARKFLLWAVCGAGKTEVLFPALQWAEDVRRRTGGEFNVLVATPRRDVVLELEPRLKKAFPGLDWTVLHGASDQRWKRSANTLATTHQVLRFAKHFDLIVVDEVDAFPFENSEMLYYAVERAVKAGGKVVLLSATPSPEMQQLVKRGKLPCARIAERFHGHPLPVPEMVVSPLLRRNMEKGIEDKLLHRGIERSLERGAQLFLFVPTIKDVDRLQRYIANRKWVGDGEMAGTHSKDPNRAEKVMAFRDRKLRVLVTTTILERGITIPCSDVMVWEADSTLFRTAALVQMAGRVGRSKEDPKGNVQFLCSKRSREVILAIRQIEDMNRYARGRRERE
jgi:competence protein ComFA